MRFSWCGSKLRGDAEGEERGTCFAGFLGDLGNSNEEFAIDVADETEARAHAVAPEGESGFLLGEGIDEGRVAAIDEDEEPPFIALGQAAEERGGLELERAGDRVVADDGGLEVAAHGVEATEAELLGVHERIGGRLALHGAEELEIPGEFLGVVDPAPEVEKVRAGVVAAVVEIDRLLLAGAAEGKGHAAG